MTIPIYANTISGVSGVSGVSGTYGTVTISTPSSSPPVSYPSGNTSNDTTGSEFINKFSIEEMEGTLKLEIKKLKVSSVMQRKIVKLNNQYIESLLDIIHDSRGSLTGEKFGV